MAGIYIHIPFCKMKCTYCDFHFSTTFEVYRERMVNAICDEVVIRAKEQINETVETVYLGGGTPSILNDMELHKIISTVTENYDLSTDLELTMECNPDDCSLENLLSWKEIGINRLSIGIQSLEEDQLDWMNRAHNSNESIEAVKRAHEAGFRNITIDLIYGLPNLTNKRWEETIRLVAELPINHISAYCLTVEEKTTLASWVKSGKIRPATNDNQSEQFVILVETLKQLGFEQYEISNFARNNSYSRHNTAYWQNKNYLGIGPSAHGFDGEKRYWNIANNQAYMKSIEAGELPQEEECLTNHDKFNERIMVGLRTKWGVSLSELKTYLELDSEWLNQVQEYQNEKLLIVSGDHLMLTEEGKLRADAIAADLFKLSN